MSPVLPTPCSVMPGYSPGSVFTSWQLANTTNQSHLFPFVGELVNQHTKMRRKGMEEEETGAAVIKECPSTTRKILHGVGLFFQAI